jgi:oligopeptide transport system substrate-binding protein
MHSETSTIFSRLAFLLWGLSLFGLGFGLAGCDNSPYPPGETGKSILYLALGDDPKTLDPTVAYDVASGEVVNLIYPAYLEYDHLKRNPLQLDLDLGATMPVYQSVPVRETVDGKQGTRMGQLWTFHIRHDLRFQDDPCFPGGKGRPITAADFVFSFKRIADPGVNCPIVNYLDDKVVGMHDFEDYQMQREKRGLPPDYSYPLPGLQLDPHDPYTFRILLDRPYPQLRYLMAMSFTTPIPHEAVEKYGKNFARHPVGCGTFMLKEYVPKDRIVLVVNPNRHPEYYPSEGEPGDRAAGLLVDAGKQLPLVKEIRFSIIKEPLTAWNLFQQGYLDLSGVSQINFQQALSSPGQLSPEMRARGIRLFKTTGADVSYFIFNMDDPVYGGYTRRAKLLRHAIALAMNQQEFIDLLFVGLGKPAQFLIPPGLFGYDPNYKNPYQQYNLELAKKLLAEAGYPGGVDPKTGQRLVLYYDNSGVDAEGRLQTALVIKQIQKLGIEVVPRSWRFPIFQSRVDQGQFQFIYFGWVADYPDPENFLLLLYGPNRRPGPNAAAYNNPAYNALFTKMRAMEDGPERAEIIRQMRNIAVEDGPMIYGVHSESYGLVQPWLRNVKPNPIALDSPKYYAVDATKRLRLQREWNRPNLWPLVGLVVFLTVGSLPAVQVVRQRSRRHVRVHPPKES